jgi:hypothetical protein
MAVSPESDRFAGLGIKPGHGRYFLLRQDHSPGAEGKHVGRPGGLTRVVSARATHLQGVGVHFFPGGRHAAVIDHLGHQLVDESRCH